MSAMRILTLFLVLALQLMSLPARGDVALRDIPDVPCLCESADSGDDDDATLRRHQAGATCALSCGVVFCEITGAGFDGGSQDRMPGVGAPVFAQATAFLVTVLRC
jgi:hypothetical protein